MDWEDQHDYGDDRDYPYTQNEVNDLLEELYVGIMEEVKEVYQSPKNSSTKFFRINPKRLRYKTKIEQKLFEFLKSGGYIDTTEENFKIIFSGEDIPESFKKIKWLKQLNHCPYLFEELADKQLISNYRLPKKIEVVFGIGGVSQKIHRYRESAIGVPNNSKLIDAIVSNVLRCLE